MLCRLLYFCTFQLRFNDDSTRFDSIRFHLQLLSAPKSAGLCRGSALRPQSQNFNYVHLCTLCVVCFVAASRQLRAHLGARLPLNLRFTHRVLSAANVSKHCAYFASIWFSQQLKKLLCENCEKIICERASSWVTHRWWHWQ